MASQSILSLDVTREPAEAAIVHVEGKKIEVLQCYQVAFGQLFSRETLSSLAQSKGATSNQEAVTPESTAGQSPVESSSQAEASVTDQSRNQPSSPFSPELKNVFSSMNVPWTGSVLIIPPYDYLSLNLDLPFGDIKSIGKILDLEVQDRIPFDLSEFLLEARPMSLLPSKSHDVHVSMIPRVYIKNVLGICKHIGLEPLIISTPPSILEAIYYLSAESLGPNSAIILEEDPFYYMTIRIDGQVKSDRILNRLGGRTAIVHGNGNLLEHSRSTLFTELKLTLMACERRYERQIYPVYLIRRTLELEMAESLLGRPVQDLKISQVVNAYPAEFGIAGLGAVFAGDVGAPSILTNFRTKEFAYSPKLKEIYESFRGVFPFVLGIIVFSLLAIAVSYYVREMHIKKVRAALHGQMRTAIASLGKIDDGQEMKLLNSKMFDLERELDELGSPSKLSPLDSLVEISNDFPLSSGVSITRLSIKGNEIIVEGNAPDYSAVESIQKTLKKKTSLYCRVTKDSLTSSVAGPNVKGFKFTIYLCE